MRFAIAVSLVGMLLHGAAGAEAPAQDPQAQATKPAPKKTAKKKPPTLAELRQLVADQTALIEEQQRQIAEQQAKINEQETKLGEQSAAVAEQKAKLAELEEQLQMTTRRLDELQGETTAADAQKALEERLKKVEEASAKVPELADVASAGNFPGSIRIPGTDTAVKFGGRIRTAAVFTLDPLGSEDRFLTNSIPVEPSDEAAGKGRRTTFSANTSRFNFEMRTPTGVGQLRTFIEGDFFGEDGTSNRTTFRLRHAFAQFHGFIMGQTWSTFSDPAADHQDLDFEGINGENVIRQAQFRYNWQLRKDVSVAGALETPKVSLTGGQGVNLVPDLVGRVIWSFKEIGHLQGSVVFREIRGEPDAPVTTGADSATAWGASLSGVVPFHYFTLVDRFIFQLNFGKGIARYINDLSSLGGQDAFFNPTTGELEPLTATGWYLDYEHQWKQWQRTRDMKLRSSLIWSFVKVDNLDFQLPSAYRKTNRYSVNVVFSPIQRIDIGIEYIYGTRQNKDGHEGNATQVQFVGIYRF